MLTRFRVCGTVAAFDVVTSAGTNYYDNVGARMREQFISEGFLIRPLGNTVYLMPPYCIDMDQLSAAYAAIRRVLDGLLA